MLFKEIVDARTDARTTDIEGSQKLTEHFVLRWAKNIISPPPTWSNIVLQFINQAHTQTWEQFTPVGRIFWHSGMLYPRKRIPSSGSNTEVSVTRPLIPLMPPYIWQKGKQYYTTVTKHSLEISWAVIQHYNVCFSIICNKIQTEQNNVIAFLYWTFKLEVFFTKWNSIL